MARRPILGWAYLKQVCDSPYIKGSPVPGLSIYGLSQYVIHGILCVSLGDWPPTPEIQARVWGWIKTHIHSGDHETPFLRSSGTTNQESILHITRVVDLAEMMYNLQVVPSIHSAIYKRIFTNPAELESTTLELEGLRLLFFSGLKFKLIAQGTQTLNYDCEIILSDTLTAFCELKCKIEGTRFSKSAITGPLEHARRSQLPKDGCGIVIIKIPEEWPIDFQPLIDEAVISVLRNTKRISEVAIFKRIFIFDRFKSVYLTSLKEILNLKSPFLSQLNEGIFNREIFTAKTLSDSIKHITKTGWVTFPLLTRRLIESQVPPIHKNQSGSR